MERPVDDEPAEQNTEVSLEHRWGERLRCKARVRLSTSTGITGSGRVRDISSSGAFIETTVSLPADIEVELVVLGNESAMQVVNMKANVVRNASDGIAVEWCRTPACVICSVIGCSVPCVDPARGD